MIIRCIILLLITFASNLNGQALTDEQRVFLNKEIRFLNESIHRMVIVFQVYENYNSEVTKHVDLPSNKGIQNTSTHLPPNLFADNNLVRGGDSPLELYEELKQDPIRNKMPVNNWSLIEQAKDVIDFLSKDRKKLDQIIDNGDMEKFSNIQLVYSEIELTLKNYDKFRNIVKTFEKLHQRVYHDQVMTPEKKRVYTALLELHYDIKKLVRQLRADSQSGVINGLSKIEKELGWVRACISELGSQDQKSDLLSVATSIEKLVGDINNYINDKKVPQGYEAFGKGYYFHNYELLPKINQYGSGYAWKLDEFFKKYNWKVLNLLEEPHYLKVVYPERLPVEMMTGDEIPPEQNIREIIPPTLPELENIVVAKSTDASGNDIDPFFLPKPAEETPEPETEKIEAVIPPNIVASQTIRVDSAFFELDLFDHLRKDGDRVSISVNGEWVFERISLERTSRKLKLSVSPGVANTVIIRADNVGWSTPNTVGIRYISKNTAYSVAMQQDLQLNEAIELKFVH